MLTPVNPVNTNLGCRARWWRQAQGYRSIVLWTNKVLALKGGNSILSGFTNNSGVMPGWLAWKGDPDDNAAHQRLLDWLVPVVGVSFWKDHVPVSNRVKGNLGEFIAYSIGKHYVFHDNSIADTANASEPLSDISRPGLDIIWIHFGGTEFQDWAVVQEVKTTGAASLQIADDLISDYGKLFGENLRLTLQTRLAGVKNRLDQHGQGHLAPRLTALGGPSPRACNGIRLFPTIIARCSVRLFCKDVCRPAGSHRKRMGPQTLWNAGQ